jgi:hypothetical protein
MVVLDLTKGLSAVDQMHMFQCTGVCEIHKWNKANIVVAQTRECMPMWKYMSM